MDDRVEKVEIDVSKVETAKELHQVLKVSLGVPNFYGMNWDAFWDAIRGLVDMPHKLVLKGWANVEKVLPNDARIMRELLDEFNSTYRNWACEVEYR